MKQGRRRRRGTWYIGIYQHAGLTAQPCVPRFELIQGRVVSAQHCEQKCTTCPIHLVRNSLDVSLCRIELTYLTNVLGLKGLATPCGCFAHLWSGIRSGTDYPTAQHSLCRLVSILLLGLQTAALVKCYRVSVLFVTNICLSCSVHCLSD